MTINRVKLERAVIFIKYTASVVPLIFPPKTLILKKIVLATSNSLKVLELVGNELGKSFSECVQQFFFFFFFFCIRFIVA